MSTPIDIRMAVVFALMLSGCATLEEQGGPARRQINLIVSNNTRRPETIQARIKSGQKEMFSRKFSLLPGGTVFVENLLQIPDRTWIRICSTLVAYPENPKAHYCRDHYVNVYDVDCVASGYDDGGTTKPYASAGCSDTAEAP